MGIVAHLGGIPVEETALSLIPVVTVIGGMVVAHLWGGIRRRVAGR
jgi:hypothetical protein